MNEFLLIGEIVLMYIVMYTANELFGKKGNVLWIVLGYILFMLFCSSLVPVWGFSVNTGTVLSATILVMMNLILQKYGKEDLRNIWPAIALGITIIYLSLVLVNYLGVNSDLVNSTYFDKVFNIPFRVYLGIFVTSYITLHFNSYLYYEIRIKKNKIWISNLLSLIISGFIDTVIFSIIAFAGIIDTLDLIIMIIMVTILKIAIGMVGTLFLYKESRIK